MYNNTDICACSRTLLMGLQNTSTNLNVQENNALLYNINWQFVLTFLFLFYPSSASTHAPTNAPTSAARINGKRKKSSYLQRVHGLDWWHTAWSKKISSPSMTETHSSVLLPEAVSTQWYLCSKTYCSLWIVLLFDCLNCCRYRPYYHRPLIFKR